MFSLDPQKVASSFMNSPLATWEWNPSTDELCWTSGQASVYSYSADELNSSAAWSAIVHQEDRERFLAATERTLQTEAFSREHFRVQTKDDKTLWILGYIKAVRLADNSTRIIGMNMEVTDWVEALYSAEARFSSTFEQAAVGIAHIGTDGQWLDVNHRCCEILGYSREELLNVTFSGGSSPAGFDLGSTSVGELLRGERKSYSIEASYITRSKGSVWVNLTVSLVRRRDGTPHYFIAVVEDITSRRRLRAQRDELIEVLEERVRERTAELEMLSMTDSLTSVANRRRLDEQLELEWDRSVRASNPISIIIIDIDRFKELNDCLGHGEADRALIAFACELKKLGRRPADLIARYGGDEFVFLLPDTDSNGAVCIANQIQAAVHSLNFPNPSSPFSAILTVSQGVATAWPTTKGTVGSLMLAADRALYIAKQRGRNSFSVADSLELPTGQR